jgi:cation diffusion facilitator CzcD-associated flavoprotein CzcO
MRVGISQAVIDADSEQLRKLEHLCAKNLDTVADPELREKLRPNYRAACKRLIFSSDFYEAIQKPNAVLVTEGIDRVEPRGVRTVDGVTHELDVLVLATGFQVDRFVRPIRVLGRDGVDLDEVWADGPLAHLSVTVPGFPNFFMLNGPNGPVGNFSLIDVAELQLGYVMQLIELLRTGQCREVSPTEEATEAFESERRAAAANTVWATGCASWYLDRRGVPATWTFSWDRFCEEMAAPKLDQFERR